MQIIDNIIIVSIHVLCFIAGMRLANFYNRKAEIEKKEALEKQFLRLKVRADADDPCKPYIAPQYAQYIPVNYNTGDFDGDLVNEEFMNRLKKTGRATIKINKTK